MLASGSLFPAFTVCVAPNSFAILSLLSSRSTAMIFSAPASTAPWMTLSPTPPAPKAATALAAMAAWIHPAEDHVIARCHRRHAGSDLGDDARAFVTDDARRRHGQDAALDAEVAVTHAARRELDAHLALAWRRKLYILDRERLVPAVHDGGAHGGPPRGLRFGGGYTTVARASATRAEAIPLVRRLRQSPPGGGRDRA